MMQAAAVIAGGEALVGMLGKDVLAHAISDTTRKIFALMDDHEHLMERLDLRARLETIEALMRDVEGLPQLPDSTAACLRALHDIVDRMHRDMEALAQAVAYDATRYLNAWRYASYRTQ